jgi:hypothetical protein
MHRTSIIQDNSSRWYAACNCGWNSGPNRFLNRWQAEDREMVHQGNVRRAQAALRRGGTMLGEYEHALKMADDPNVPAVEREMWRGLAAGYASRLGKPLDEDGLF